MGVYLVRAVKLVDGEVEEAEVAAIGAIPGKPGEFALEDSKILGRADLATLVIVKEVRVAKIPDPGYGPFGVGSRVRRKGGQMEYTTSINEDGTPNDDLINLPKLT